MDLLKILEKPERTFKLNERVLFGAHNEVYVRNISDDKITYKIECVGVVRRKYSPPHNEFYDVKWYELFKYNSLINKTDFTILDDVFINYNNSTISSLLHFVFSDHVGVNFNIDYQRDYVWKLPDKRDLINSIFNNIDIGRFLFSENHYTSNELYTIIDGKQRLSTLCEFYCDKFTYNNKKFSQLSPNDKNTITEHPITYGVLRDASYETQLKTFIKLNTTGKTMDKKYINHAIELLNNIKK